MQFKVSWTVASRGLILIADISWGSSAHRYLYYKGILHRDISIGNILISPDGINAEKTSGCLIDLDYAKKTSIDPKPPTVNSPQQDERSSKIRQGVSLTLEGYHSAGIDDKALSALLSLCKTTGSAIDYVEHILQSKPSLSATNKIVSVFALRFTVI